MHLSMHTAQASDNAPFSKHAVGPIGLGVHLSVTAAVPATEMSSVAAGAPARVITTPPTYLHPSLRRLADGSRPPTPEGSRPPFGWGPVATPIQPITGRPSLAPSSFTRNPIGSPCGSLSPRGGLRAYHVAPRKPRGLGRASTPVARHLRRGSSEPPDLATYHFGSSLSAASESDTKGPHLACRTSRPLRHFTWVDLTTPS